MCQSKVRAYPGGCAVPVLQSRYPCLPVVQLCQMKYQLITEYLRNSIFDTPDYCMFAELPKKDAAVNGFLKKWEEDGGDLRMGGGAKNILHFLRL